MGKIMVLQHVPYELLGTMNPLFKKQGLRIKYVNFGRHPLKQPEITGYDGLVILGGGMNVDQVAQYPHLQTEIDLIRKAMSENIPTLGICLGSQLIAAACGATVKKNVRKEIGWYDIDMTANAETDPLFKHFDKKEKIFQWHGYTFDLPQDAIHLASSQDCTNQAFRVGDSVYGLQFHLEVDPGLIERWLSVPAHLKELEELQGQIDPETIRADIPKYIERSNQLSESVFLEFIKMIGHQNSPIKLESR